MEPGRELTARPGPVTCVVVMGVMGAGKTRIASALAARLSWRLADGDDLHPPANVAKMRAGRELEDADRLPWLDAVVDWLDGCSRDGRPGVVACSALRRAYRDRLMASRADVRFAYLDVPIATLRQRVESRDHAYMPASLLESQLATLEPLEAEEPGITIRGDRPIDEVVAEIVAEFALPIDG